MKSDLLAIAKPILFNTEMVQAILGRRKTQTRRLIKNNTGEILKSECRKKFANIPDNQFIEKLCIPQYEVGNILYVRETWCELYPLADDNCTIIGEPSFYYAADGYNPTPYNCFPDENGFDTDRGCPRWKPSIHMPKEAARIFLKITDVKAERLQDITAEQCVSEGIPIESLSEVGADFTIGQFSDLWDSTIKKADIEKYGYNSNPWVWVYTFEVLEVINNE